MLSKLDCFFFYFLLYIVQYVDNQLVICNYLPMQKVLYFNNLFLYQRFIYVYVFVKGQTGDKNWGKKCKKEQV